MSDRLPIRSGFPSLFIILLLFIPTLLSAPPQANTNALPSIVLVPGAWHSPIHYTELIGLLIHNGYHVGSQRLPSCNSAKPNVQTVANDAAAVRNNLILPQLNQGKEVVVLMHSYGGAPGSMAAKGLSLSERRAAGKPGGIIGLIVLCGFLANTGQSLLSELPGQVFDPWVIEYVCIFRIRLSIETDIVQSNGQLGVQNARDVFYNDVPDHIAAAAVAEIRNQSRNSLESPSGPPAWADSVFNGRRSYLHTLQDHGIPPIGQNAMLQASGVSWDITSFNTSHSPYLSEPYQVRAWIVREIAKFRAGGTATQ
ncbi:hypothetical protein ACLMJK_000360 [Lecanora helva]